MKCPNCGSPVQIRGGQWECGWCGNYGQVVSGEELPYQARKDTQSKGRSGSWLWLLLGAFLLLLLLALAK